MNSGKNISSFPSHFNLTFWNLCCWIGYEKIEDIRLRKTLPALYQNNRDLRLDALLNLYSDLRDEASENLAYLDPVTRDYTTLFGKIIADSAQNLLILQLSDRLFRGV